MKRKQSELTFKELTNRLGYVKVIYNGQTIYDDYDGEETVESLHRMQDEYNNKIVYSMKVQVVGWHHCILTVKGE